LIENTVLFTTAKKLLLQKVMPYGEPKKKDEKTTVTEDGEFVSVMLCVAKAPFNTRLTIFAKRNASRCLTLADDLRKSKATS
jgi:hypothetical protein